MFNLVPLQSEFSQELPVVLGNVDYKIFRETLERIKEIIQIGELEKEVMKASVKKAEEAQRRYAQERGKKFKGLRGKEQARIQRTVQQALRCGIARHLTGESYREFTRRLADSALLQRFCLIDRIDEIRVPSKSTLERYEKLLPEGEIREVVQKLTRMASEPQSFKDPQPTLRLKEPISLEDLYLDSTCVKACIHFPVDWVLLRDAIRTLMKAVSLIRKAGLKNRMDDPADFITQMNKLCIKMSQTRRQKEGKKGRKQIFRLMKKLMKKVQAHATKHQDLLERNWKHTELTEAETKQILGRIHSVLEKLPAAVYQAHERIIGERQVRDEKKILSLYEPDIHVIVRGKSGSEVEFGNTLLLGEQSNGVIVDWKLYNAKVPSDSQLLQESVERIKRECGFCPERVTTDRGFYSQLNEWYLSNEQIESHMCPRSVKKFQERLKEEGFCQQQRRRAQTEGRIAILKNNFLGRPLRSKGFASRDLGVAWGILSHNLWVIARLPKAEEQEYQKAA